jgi:hypothetical protein
VVERECGGVCMERRRAGKSKDNRERKRKIKIS